MIPEQWPKNVRARESETQVVGCTVQKPPSDAWLQRRAFQHKLKVAVIVLVSARHRMTSAWEHVLSARGLLVEVLRPPHKLDARVSLSGCARSLLHAW